MDIPTLSATKSALIGWGGWSRHEPEQCAARFSDKLKEIGMKVEVSDTVDVYLDEKLMKEADLIVQARTRPFGQGRMFFASLGHVNADFDLIRE